MQVTLKNDQLVEFYTQMYEIRRAEEALLDIFSKGMVMGTTHTCIGQESTAVGVVNAIDRDKDFIFSNHRGHGHFLAYCKDVKGLLLEVIGSKRGVCQGIGGSQHLHYKNFYSSGIQGGLIPIALGVGFAEKNKGTDAIVLIFIGDGTLAEGIVYEGLNIAALWGLPILFVVEDNKYAQSTPSMIQHSGELSTRADTFGIRSFIAEDNGVMAINAVSVNAVNYVRSHKKPAYLYISTYRLAPHSKGDDNRDPSELAAIKKQDPLRRLKDILKDKGVPEPDLRENAIDREIQQVLDECKDDHIS